MLLLIIPLFWVALWVALALVICAALGIAPGDPRLWWYGVGIFLGGGVVLPAAVGALWVRFKGSHKG